MKRAFLIILVAAAFILSDEVESVPLSHPCGGSIDQPVGYVVRECASCPYGYQCRYGWFPQVTFFRPVWVFGISTMEQCGGILNFREYPEYPCRQHCVDKIDVLFTADVIYVPPWGGEYSFENVPLTYIPAGKYVVTSPSFFMRAHMKLWYFYDDGTGPTYMNATLNPDKPRYGKEDTLAVLQLQVRDTETGENIQVDTVRGAITLPDSTVRTVSTEDWLWNSADEWYEFYFNFLNDDGIYSDPKEGYYSAEFVVKKKYYQDVFTSTTLDVCYHCVIVLTFDKPVPEYSPGESVIMKVLVTCEEGELLTIELDSVVTLPDGSEITDLEWTSAEGGLVTSYIPEEEGEYHVWVGIKEDIICYLEEATGVFCVRECKEALVHLDISPAVIHEVVEFTLTAVDDKGYPLCGGEIESILQLPDGSAINIEWAEQGYGVYKAQYVPTNIGLYSLYSTIVVTEEDCYKGFFSKSFLVEEKKLPDLFIRNEEIVIEPDPNLGDTVTISVTVQNIGNADAENFLVVILINNKVVHKEVVEVLAAGESIIIEYEWTVLYTGGYIIQVIADPPEGLL